MVGYQPHDHEEVEEVLEMIESASESLIPRSLAERQEVKPMNDALNRIKDAKNWTDEETKDAFSQFVAENYLGQCSPIQRGTPVAR